MICLSFSPPRWHQQLSSPSFGALSVSLLEIISLNVHIVEVFLVVCSHYVLSYGDISHYHFTCDCYVFWSVPYHHDSCTCSLLCGPDDGQDVVLLPQLFSRDTLRGSAGIMHLPQQPPQSNVPSQAYAKYAIGPLQVSFSFRVESPNNSYIMCLVSVMVFAFRFQCGCCVHLWRLNIWSLHCTTNLQRLPLAGICAFWWWSMAHAESALSGCFSHCFQLGEPLLISLFPSHSSNMVGFTASGAW